MVKISVFADEVTPDIAGQIKFLTKQNLRNLEIRFIKGINIVKTGSGELKETAKTLKDNNISIAADQGAGDLSAQNTGTTRDDNRFSLKIV